MAKFRLRSDSSSAFKGLGNLRSKERRHGDLTPASQLSLPKGLVSLPTLSSWRDIVVGKLRGRLLLPTEETMFTGFGFDGAEGKRFPDEVLFLELVSEDRWLEVWSELEVNSRLIDDDIFPESVASEGSMVGAKNQIVRILESSGEANNPLLTDLSSNACFL